METSATDLSALNQYYVYIYLDSRKPGDYSYTDKETGEIFKFNYEPFYVGSGKDGRWKFHLYESSWKPKKTTNRLKCNTIKKIIKETGKDPIILKLSENLFEEKSKELEILFIKIIGRKDLGLGPLTNMTDGGEGKSGWIMPEKTRRKLRKANIGKKLTEEHRGKLMKWAIGNTNMLGKHHSKESIKAISTSLIGNKYSECFKYILDNGENYDTFYTSIQKIRIRSLFCYYKSNIINYKGIKIERRNINEYITSYM